MSGEEGRCSQCGLEPVEAECVLFPMPDMLLALTHSTNCLVQRKAEVCVTGEYSRVEWIWTIS